MKSRERRVVFVGGMVLLLAVFVLRIVPAAVRAHTSLRSRAVEQTNTLQKARETVSSFETFRDSLAVVLNDLVTLAPKLLGGDTPAEAGSSLAGLVSLAAERGGLRVLRVDPRPDSVGDVFGTTRQHALLEGDIAGLVEFLTEIEAGETVLSVESLVVNTPMQTANIGAYEVLQVEVEISGLFLLP